MKTNAKKTLRMLTAAILCLVLTLLCWGAVLLTHPETVRIPVLPENAVSVLSQAAFRPVNASFSEERVFRVRRSDAQLYIEGIDMPVQTLCVRTREPFPSDISCQLFYALDGGPISEAQSVRIKTPAASRDIVFALPASARYDFFRLDIDRNYTLSDLLAADAPPEYEEAAFSALLREGRISVPLRQLAVGWALFFAGALCVMRATEKKQSKRNRKP